MSETGPEAPREHAPITDDEIYQTLDNRLKSWDFKQHEERENVEFAHTVSSLVCDSFPYLNYAGSQTFEASELPGPIRPLYSTIWSPGGESRLCYVHDMTIRRVRRREEHTEISPQVAGFDELMAQGKSFEQIIVELKADPDIKDKIIPGETILDEGIIIVLATEYGPEGLEFIVEPDAITLSIFGREGSTRNLSRFLIEYTNNQNELARMSAQLAVLGARYCMRPLNYQYADLHLTAADRKFLHGI